MRAINIFRLSLVLMFTLTGTLAQAQLEEGDSGTSAFGLNTTFWGNGLALGADYENGIARTHSVGGYARFYPESKATNTYRGAPGLFMFGGFVRPHFKKRNWDFYVSPGFGLTNYSSGSTDATVFGPTLAYGLLYQLKSNLSVGLENFHMHFWFGDKKALGQASELSAKVRFSF